MKNARFILTSLLLLVCCQGFSQNQFDRQSFEAGRAIGEALGQALFGGSKKSNTPSSGSSYSSSSYGNNQSYSGSSYGSSSIAFYVEASKGTSNSSANVIVLNLNASGGIVMLTKELCGEGYSVRSVKENLMKDPNFYENLAASMHPNANDQWSKLLVYKSTQNGYNFYTKHINTTNFWGNPNPVYWYYALSTDKKTFITNPTNDPKYYVRVNKSEFEVKF